MPQNIKQSIIDQIQACPNQRLSLFNLRRLCGKPNSESAQTLEQMFKDGELLVYRNANQDVVVADPTVPTYKTKHSAGADVPSLVDITIPAGEQVLVPTTLMVKDLIGLKQVAFLTARSSFFNADKGRKLLLTNGIGTIDPDYPKNVAYSYINLGAEDVTIEAGTSVGQVVVLDTDVSHFPTHMQDREGGWGSTDKPVEEEQPELDDELTDDTGVNDDESSVSEDD